MIAGGAGAAVGILLVVVDELPPIQELEYYDPPESTFVYDNTGQGRPLAEFYHESKRYVLKYDQIPVPLIKAFLAVEDRRYYDHFGVDIIGVARAALANYRTGGRPQGASTISMQLPGNVLKEVDRTEIPLYCTVMFL